MKKILIHLTANTFGGVETHVFYLARELARRDAHVTIISQRHLSLNGEWLAQLEASGVEIIHPRFKSTRGAIGLLLNRLDFLVRLRKREWDVIVGQSHGAAFLWMRRFLAPGGRLLWQEQWYGSPTRGDEYSEYKPIEPQVFGKRMRKVVRQADEIITGSELAKHNLVHLQGATSPIHLIAPLDHFVPGDAEERAYDSKTTLRVIMLGRLGVGKGTKMLLELWPRLAIGPAELHLYGAVTEGLDDLARRTPGVIAHGNFERATLEAIVASADLALMLSIEEGFGLATLEYMACGVPFVMTECGAAREFTADNPDSELVAVNEEAVKQGIERLAARVRNGGTSRTRLQRFHRDRFSYSAAVARYVEVLLGG